MGSIYIAEMKVLEEKEPDNCKHLCNGGFVVRQIDHHKFNIVATDQAVE